MKSLWITLSCAAFLAISASTAKAASLHGLYESENQIESIEWVVELYYRQDTKEASLFATEKFSDIPQSEVISLSFDYGSSDPLGLFSPQAKQDSTAFHEKWLSLLLGVRTWDIEKEGSFYSPSDY